MAAGFLADAAVGVIGIGEAQVRVGVGTGLGLDVFYLAFGRRKRFFALNAQASLVGVLIGLHSRLDRLKGQAIEVSHGGCRLGGIESGQRRCGHGAVLQFHHGQFTLPALRAARKRQVVRSLS